MRVTSPGPRLYCHNLDDNLMSAPIGLSVKRREDRRFLTGRGRYVDDLRLPDLLHAAIVRSPHAHARILGVDTNRALALPGVVAVLTITELPECVAAVPPLVPSPRLRPYAQPAIASAKARYAGEAVAVVVADDVYRATDGASVVDVRYDVLPAAVTVDAALATGAPRVFDEWPDNAAGPSDGAVGDIVRGFAEAQVDPEDVLLAAVARRLGRPVKWMETPREHFLATAPDRDQRHRARLGVARDGAITAVETEFTRDGGDYPVSGDVISLNTINHLPGPYRIAHLKGSAINVVTHKTFTAAYRGAGRPE